MGYLSSFYIIKHDIILPLGGYIFILIEVY